MPHPPEEYDELHPCSDPTCLFGEAGKHVAYNDPNTPPCDKCQEVLDSITREPDLAIRLMSHSLYLYTRDATVRLAAKDYISADEVDKAYKGVQDALVAFEVLWRSVRCPLFVWGALRLETPLPQFLRGMDFFHETTHDLFSNEEMRRYIAAATNTPLEKVQIINMEGDMPDIDDLPTLVSPLIRKDH